MKATKSVLHKCLVMELLCKYQDVFSKDDTNLEGIFNNLTIEKNNTSDRYGR